MTADESAPGTQPGEARQAPDPGRTGGGEDPPTVYPTFHLSHGLSHGGSRWVLSLECRWPADPDRMMDEGFGMAALLTDTVRRILRGEARELSWLPLEEEE